MIDLNTIGHAIEWQWTPDETNQSQAALEEFGLIPVITHVQDI